MHIYIYTCSCTKNTYATSHIPPGKWKICSCIKKSSYATSHIPLFTCTSTWKWKMDAWSCKVRVKRWAMELQVKGLCASNFGFRFLLFWEKMQQTWTIHSLVMHTVINMVWPWNLLLLCELLWILGNPTNPWRGHANQSVSLVLLRGHYRSDCGKVLVNVRIWYLWKWQAVFCFRQFFCITWRTELQWVRLTLHNVKHKSFLFVAMDCFVQPNAVTYISCWCQQLKTKMYCTV